MRHRKRTKKLGRTASHRKAMLRNMATSFFEHERIKSSERKIKTLRPIVEKLITLGKRGDLHSHRLAMRYLRDKEVARKVFTEIGPRYSERDGGYTRIIRLGKRDSDAAPMCLIELV